MRSAPNFGDLLLDRRPSHFVPPEMRERRLLALPSASGSGPVSFARRVRSSACAGCWMNGPKREIQAVICHGGGFTASPRLEVNPSGPRRRLPADLGERVSF